MKKILCVMIALLVLVSCYALAEGGCDHNNRTVKTISSVSCTTDGKEAEVCLDCGATIDSWVTAKATGHSWGTPVVKEGNCLTATTTTTKCNTCGETKVETGSIGLHAYESKCVREASCTEPAYYEERCTVCNDLNDSWTKGDKLNHSYKVVILTPATCTTLAIEGEKCERCQHVNDDKWTVGTLAPHTLATQPAVAATCTSTGKTEGSYCTKCDYVEVPQTETAMLPHTSVTIAGVAPTCTETGLTDGAKCGVCGYELKAQETVDALGHDWYKRVVKPTETSRGFTEYSCTRGCGEWFRRDYTDKLTAEIAIDVALNPYGSIVTDLDDNDKPYTAELDEETNRLYIIAKAESDGTFPLRELHLDLGLIAELKEDGIVDICFVVGDAEIVVPFTAFEGEIMETIKADFPETLTGYIVTLDVNAVNAEGVAGCLVKVDMSADTEEADGIEMEITDVMTGMSLLLGETPIAVVGGGVYTA